MSLLLATKKSSLPTPEFAVGLKAINGFSGDVVTARETGGDTEQSFTASEVVGSGAGSLDDFIGANDARLKFLLNQGSLALTNELGQTTNADQPAIATSGSVLTDSNGNPIIDFQSTKSLITTDSILMNDMLTSNILDFSCFFLYEYTSNTDVQIGLIDFRSTDLTDRFAVTQLTDAYPGGSSGGNIRTRFDDNGSGVDSSILTAPNAVNTQRLLSFFCVSGTFYYYMDGSFLSSVVQSTNPFNLQKIIVGWTSASQEIKLKEIQLYSGDLRTDRVSIESDINARWS